MVRIEFPKRPDPLDVDILRCVKLGGNYPMAAYRKLHRIYPMYYDKRANDETVRLRFRWLFNNGYLSVGNSLKDAVRKRYCVTEKGEELLSKTLVIDVNSGPVLGRVYALRTAPHGECDGPVLSVETDSPTTVRVYVNGETLFPPTIVMDGHVDFPLQSDADAFEVIAQTEGNFAKLSVDRGILELDRWPKLPQPPVNKPRCRVR